MQEDKSKIENIYYEKLNFVKLFINELYYRAPHFHPEFEVNLICDGQCEITFKSADANKNSVNKLLKKGDIFIYNSYQNHELKSVKTEKGKRVKILAMQIPTNWLKNLEVSNILFNEAVINYSYEDEQKKELYHVFLILAKNYFENRPYYKLLCNKNLCDLFYRLIQLIPHTEIDDKTDLSEQIRIQKLLTYLEENFKNKVSLKELSDLMHLSPQYLSHYFTKSLGYSLREYLTKLRFNHSIYLIDNTELPLIDICYECGFSDYKYMVNVFKGELGITPREYRKHNIVAKEKPYKSTNEYIYSDTEALALINSLLDEYF